MTISKACNPITSLTQRFCSTEIVSVKGKVDEIPEFTEEVTVTELKLEKTPEEATVTEDQMPMVSLIKEVHEEEVSATKLDLKTPEQVRAKLEKEDVDKPSTSVEMELRAPKPMETPGFEETPEEVTVTEADRQKVSKIKDEVEEVTIEGVTFRRVPKEEQLPEDVTVSELQLKAPKPSTAIELTAEEFDKLSTTVERELKLPKPMEAPKFEEAPEEVSVADVERQKVSTITEEVEEVTVEGVTFRRVPKEEQLPEDVTVSELELKAPKPTTAAELKAEELERPSATVEMKLSAPKPMKTPEDVSVTAERQKVSKVKDEVEEVTIEGVTFRKVPKEETLPEDVTVSELEVKAPKPTTAIELTAEEFDKLSTTIEKELKVPKPMKVPEFEEAPKEVSVTELDQQKVSKITEDVDEVTVEGVTFRRVPKEEQLPEDITISDLELKAPKPTFAELKADEVDKPEVTTTIQVQKVVTKEGMWTHTYRPLLAITITSLV